MAITIFGQILEFDEKLEDWIQYPERLEHLFTANDSDDANKKESDSPHCHRTKGVQATCTSKFSSTRKVGGRVIYILT